MICSDRGGEFLLLEFSKLCDDVGIIRQLANVDTSE